MTTYFERKQLDVLEADATVADKILGSKKRAGMRVAFIESYSYVGDVANVAPSATALTNVTINTNGDSDFLCLYLSATVFVTTTQVAIGSPYAKMQITDTYSQRTLFSAPQFVFLGSGSGGTPYILQDPKLIPANANIVVTYQNLATVPAVNHDFEIVFGGYRVYYK